MFLAVSFELKNHMKETDVVSWDGRLITSGRQTALTEFLYIKKKDYQKDEINETFLGGKYERNKKLNPRPSSKPKQIFE